MHFYNAFASNCLMLNDTFPFWTINSTVTDHIRNRNVFVNFHISNPEESESNYTGNNTSVEMLTIDTCKLVIQKGCTLYYHDVLYVLKFGGNLVFIIVLVKLGFKIVFV